FEPGSGRRIGTLEHARFDYSCPKHACAAYGPLPPGKIALGLVLPRVGPLDGVGAESIGAPSVIFENGGGDPRTAPVIDVHEGKNVRVFRLPAALLPVRTQFIR